MDWNPDWSSLPVDLDQTRNFLGACFAPDDFVRVLLKGRTNPPPGGAVAGTPDTIGFARSHAKPSSVVAGGGFLSFLKDANLNGCHVYFNVNPVRPDARGGTKGDIARAARVWIDVDGGVDEVFERLAACGKSR